MSWKGPAGARPFWGYEEIMQIKSEIIARFLTSSDYILFGFNPQPPIDLPCRVYVLFTNDAVEYLCKKDGKWVNWCYLTE